MRRSCPKPLYGLILAIAIAHFACKPTQQAVPADPQKAPAAVVSPYLDFSGEYYPDEIQGSDMYLVISKKSADSLNYKVVWASDTKQIKQSPGLGLQHKRQLLVARGSNPAVAYLTMKQYQWMGNVVQGNCELIANGLVLPKGLPAVGAKSAATDTDFRLKLSSAGDVLLTGQLAVSGNGGDVLYLTFTPANTDYAPFMGMAYKMSDGAYEDGLLLVWQRPEPGVSPSSGVPMLSFAAYNFSYGAGNKLEAKGFAAEFGDTDAMPIGLQPK